LVENVVKDDASLFLFGIEVFDPLSLGFGEALIAVGISENFLSLEVLGKSLLF
jgi:hypothetical protein